MSTTRTCPSCGRKVSFFAMTREGVCEDCLRAHGAEVQASSGVRVLEIERETSRRIAAGEPVDWPSIPPRVTESLAAAIQATTTLEIPGRAISEVVRIVGSEAALGMNMFRDLANTIRDAAGGRSATIQQALRVNRETCLLELRREALFCGADAIVAIKLDYSEFSSGAVPGGMLFTAATGTAVRLAPQA